ncbi:MAG TPA: fumarylacetoacetate hydrolase family protein [Burkholderiales bacterium]|nr:fumarylacetoacetate hydrolase family protein [Burkholderiales bacterium]
MSGDLDAVAEQFVEAKRRARLLDEVPALKFERAYEIAHGIHRLRNADGEIGVGRKIGFTNPRMWAQYGAEAPLWAHVYDTSVHDVESESGAARFDLRETVQPKIEPEIVFRLSRVPAAGSSRQALLDCIDWVAHGFEIVDSHIADWRFTPAQAVADFGLHHALLIGDRKTMGEIADAERRLGEFDIELLCDGEVRDRGTGASVLGHPLNAILYLVDALAKASHLPQLRAGEVITTGTLTAALPIRPGERWSTKISGIELARMQVEFR